MHLLVFTCSVSRKASAALMEIDPIDMPLMMCWAFANAA